MRNDKNNLIVSLTFEFSLRILDYTDSLENQKKYVIARQLLRCGTSIGANVWEAQNSESKADFVHKFKIAAKECDETVYWLKLCEASATCISPPDELFKKVESLLRIISKIITSSKTSSNRR